MAKIQRLIALTFAISIFAAFSGGLKAQTQPPASAVTHPYPEGDKGDLWLVGGQSNMAGFGTLKQTVPPDPRVLFYASNNEWMIARDPFENLFYPSGVVHGMVPDYTHLPVGGAGPLHPFVTSLIAVTHRPIGLIGVDAGRSMGMVWDPTLMDKTPIPPPPYLYAEMIHRVIDVGGYGHLKGMLWYQGESDAVQFPETSKVYEQQLLTFIDRVRKDTGNPNLPIVIVQLSRLVYGHLPGLPGTIAGLPGTLEDKNYPDLNETVTQAWEHVREVQRRAAFMRPNVYVVPAVDLYPMLDPIHLDFEAQQRLGPRMAEVALSKIYNLPGHGTPIQLESVELEPLPAFENGKPIQGRVRIRVRFTGVTGKLHAAGRPSGFSVRFPQLSQEIIDRAAGAPAVPQNASSGFPVLYTTEFDPNDPDAVLLRLTGAADAIKTQFNAQLYYGAGLDPYCNIVDDKDMALPAFGPIPLGLMGEKVSGSE
jgi:sialate O-acetylesterase